MQAYKQATSVWLPMKVSLYIVKSELCGWFSGEAPGTVFTSPFSCLLTCLFEVCKNYYLQSELGFLSRQEDRPSSEELRFYFVV